MNKVIWRTLAGLIAMVIGFGLALAVPSPAQAYANCPSTSRCAFSGYNGGAVRVMEGDGPDRPGCFNVPNNTIASVDNIVTGSSHHMRLFRDTEDCTGFSGLVYAGTQGNMAGQHYKSANSVYVY